MKYNQGKMETNSNGVNRESNEGRGRFDLFPYEAMEALAKWYEEGAKKYGERNWEKGIDINDCLNRMVRHALKASNNFEDEDHLSAVMWNAAAVITMRKRRAALDALSTLIHPYIISSIDLGKGEDYISFIPINLNNSKDSDILNRTIFRELKTIIISKNSKGKPYRAATIKDSKLLTYRMTPSGGIFDVRKHNDVINPIDIIMNPDETCILCIGKTNIYQLSENRVNWIDISYKISKQTPFLNFEILSYEWNIKDRLFHFEVYTPDEPYNEKFKGIKFDVFLPVNN